MKKKPTRPKDFTQLAKVIVDLATGQTTEAKEAAKQKVKKKKKNPAAVALGKLGGLKGGKARAKKLTAKRRKEIATKAANARWK